MFLTEEDKRISEELYNNFPNFNIRVGMDNKDFIEGNLQQRQWQLHAPAKNKIWCTGSGITFVDAYQNLLKRLEEYDRL